jgi:antagonist of KipI
MGIRLTGMPIEVPLREMKSEPVVFGVVQIPPDGQPIILAADRQTIGGYPVIACVITADRPLLAQLQPGSKVRFVEVSHAEAETLIAQCEHNLATLKLALQQRT